MFYLISVIDHVHHDDSRDASRVHDSPEVLHTVRERHLGQDVPVLKPRWFLLALKVDVGDQILDWPIGWLGGWMLGWNSWK